MWLKLTPAHKSNHMLEKLAVIAETYLQRVSAGWPCLGYINSSHSSNTHIHTHRLISVIHLCEWLIKWLIPRSMPECYWLPVMLHSSFNISFSFITSPASSAHRTVSSSIGRQEEVALRWKTHTFMQLLPGVTLFFQLCEQIPGQMLHFQSPVNETLKGRPFSSGRWRLSFSEEEMPL